MKKSLFFLLICLISSFLVNSNPVDVRTASVLGQKFVEENFERIQNPTLHLTHTVMSDNDVACIYVFNVGEDGFIMVSADDRAHPILGYSEHNAFNIDDVAPGLNYMMDYYAKGIAYAVENDILADDDIRSEWKILRSAGQFRADSSVTTAVAPLLTTEWNQNYPYNYNCPEDSAGPGGRVHAGCVATAMAQIMKYWNYPAQGVGSYSYTPDGYPIQTVDFGATTYEWGNMPDQLDASSSTTVQINAVATLIHHCGVSVEMNYSPNGSGANISKMQSALYNYFGYNLAPRSNKNYYYSETEWQDDLKEALDAGRPIFYQGFYHVQYGIMAGHAFVCDGYDANNLFHFNWGWSGYDDGYFATNALNTTDYSFNVDQAAVMGIEPLNLNPCQQPLNLAINDITDTTATLTWTGSGTFEIGYKQTSDTSWTMSTIDTNQYELSNLQPSTSYDWKVRKVCDNDYSNWSNSSFQTTGPCLPISTFPYNEGFNEGVLPYCWTTIDADGDGYNWDPTFLFAVTDQMHSGNGMISSASYNHETGGLTPDNWLITPPIEVGDNPLRLKFWVQAYSPNWDNEHFGVYISTAGTEVADFVSLYQSVSTEEWVEHEVTISPQYTNQTIYIAFRHYNTIDQYRLKLDDISLTEDSVSTWFSVDYSLDSFCDENNNAIDSIVLEFNEGFSPRVILTNNGPDVPAATDTIFLDIMVNGQNFGRSYYLGSDLINLTQGMSSPVYFIDNLYSAEDMESWGLETFQFCMKVHIKGQSYDPVSSNNQVCVQVIRQPPVIVDYSLEDFCDENNNVISSIHLGSLEGFDPWVILFNNGPDIPAATDSIFLDVKISGQNYGGFYCLGSDLNELTQGMSTSVHFPYDILSAADMNSLGLINFQCCMKVCIKGKASDPVMSNNQVCIRIDREPPVYVDYALDYFCDVFGNEIDIISLAPDEGLRSWVLLTNHGPEVPVPSDKVYLDVSIDNMNWDSTFYMGSSLANVTMGESFPICLSGDVMTAEEMDSYGLEDFQFCYTVRIEGKAMDTISSNNTVCIQVTRFPCETPTNLSVSNISTHSATLKWNGIGEFEVNYKTNDAFDWERQVTQDNSVTLNDLEYATDYVWRVRSLCANESSDWASSSFQTLGVGIEDYIANNVTLYPNPTTSYIDIKFNESMQVDVLSVYDIYGKLLQTIKVTENPMRIDISDLSQGMYFVRVSTTEGIVNKSFIKR